MKDREKIILNYLEGYNNFDVSKMIAHFSDEIIFQNIQDGQVSLELNGIEDLRNQAEIAKSYFSERHQKVKSFKHNGEKTETQIEYFAISAIDFPNGMKRGQELQLNGKSIFEFKEGKIIRLTDISRTF